MARVDEVVDGHDLHVRRPLDDRLERLAPDAPEAVDADPRVIVLAAPPVIASSWCAVRGRSPATRRAWWIERERSCRAALSWARATSRTVPMSPTSSPSAAGHDPRRARLDPERVDCDGARGPERAAAHPMPSRCRRPRSTRSGSKTSTIETTAAANAAAHARGSRRATARPASAASDTWTASSGAGLIRSAIRASCGCGLARLERLAGGPGDAGARREPLEVPAAAAAADRARPCPPPCGPARRPPRPGR